MSKFKPARSDAQIEFQQRAEAIMRASGRYVFQDAARQVLDLDPVLERRLQEETQHRKTTAR